METYYTTSFKKRAKITNQVNLEQIETMITGFDSTPTVERFETQTNISNTKWMKISPKLQKGLDVVEHLLINNNRTYRGNKKDHFSFFEIPKASGGTRTISAPDEQLKECYLTVRNTIRESMMVLAHNNAYAYIKQRSTADALKVHQLNSSQYFLKIDISNFFDNCSQDLIVTQLSKVYPFYHNPSLIKLLAEFATLDDGLPQGTPLSPDLTNWIMVPFDAHFHTWCEKNGYVYTRYADDMIISHKESFKFTQVVEEISRLFTSLEYPFEIKKKKTRYGSRAGSNWNLGLMLNKDNNITVGHEFKKRIKTLIYKTVNGDIPAGDAHIMGLVAYMKQIEPAYYYSLNQYCINKYRATIDEIISCN